MLTATAPAPAPASEPIEILIGECMAAAAAGLAQALGEFQGNGLTARTKAAGGDLVAQLYELQRATHGEFDFGEVALDYGRKVLRQRCNGGGYTKGHDILIEEVLSILGRVTATMAAGLN